MASESRAIRWTTSKGTAVTLELVTGRPSPIEPRIMVPTYELIVRAGDHEGSHPTLEQHPVAGLSLRPTCSQLVIPVASEVAEQVAALVAEYHAERKARASAAADRDREYTEGRDRVLKAMGR